MCVSSPLSGDRLAVSGIEFEFYTMCTDMPTASVLKLIGTPLLKESYASNSRLLTNLSMWFTSNEMPLKQELGCILISVHTSYGFRQAYDG
jgi:hypothetical protein